MKLSESAVPRPHRHTRVVIMDVATDIYNLMSVLNAPDSKIGTRQLREEDLFDALHNCRNDSDYDGYALMKELEENHDWVGCFLTARALHIALDSMRRVVFNATLNWVKQFDIQPDLPVGSIVVAWSETCEILGYRMSTAEYQLSPVNRRDDINRAVGAFHLPYEQVKLK